jgi:hypothetical protein
MASGKLQFVARFIRRIRLRETTRKRTWFGRQSDLSRKIFHLCPRSITKPRRRVNFASLFCQYVRNGPSAGYPFGACLLRYRGVGQRRGLVPGGSVRRERTGRVVGSRVFPIRGGKRFLTPFPALGKETPFPALGKETNTSCSWSPTRPKMPHRLAASSNNPPSVAIINQEWKPALHPPCCQAGRRRWDRWMSR